MSLATIEQAAAALRARRVSSVELVDAALHQVELLNPRLNAFLTVTADAAREEARRADAELKNGHDRGPLHGLPIAHKDLFCTRYVKTTAGSRVYANYIPDFDATAVSRLREAGAISLGKTNLHEHAYGITSNNPHYGPVRNPRDVTRIPGGSSGGSGAALAAGILFLATGTDTGGSIRCPASFCGIAGIKPTYGLVSKYGVLPLGFTLDHIGPMARTVRDVAIGLQVLAGFDRQDPASVRRPTEVYLPPRDVDVKGMRVGWPSNYFFDRVDAEILAGAKWAAKQLETRGAIVTPVKIPDMVQLNAIARVTLLAEAAAIHEKHLPRRELYGADVLSLLEQGRTISAVDYLQAQRGRRRFIREFAKLFGAIDLLIAPATPTTAPLIGQSSVEIDGQAEDTRLAATRYLRGINVLGLPALAVPVGPHSNGLPFALQLIGKPFSESLLFRAGQSIETALKMVTE